MNTIPRPEHPRPDQKRNTWMNLNGQWRFAFDERSTGEKEKWYAGGAFDKAITVPFCYQSALSGINNEKHCDTVWYAREVTVPEVFTGMRILLHFGAVDYTAKVWLDGQFLGRHDGGYTPFSFDITDAVTIGKPFTIVVSAEDRLSFDRPRGKQSFRPEPFECWYTETTGIWQTVWLEGVGAYYPQHYRITPDIDKACIDLELEMNDVPDGGTLRLTASYQGTAAGACEVSLAQPHVRACVYLPHDETIEGFHRWFPNNPALYDLKIETIADGVVVDTVETYFGMRKIEIYNGRITLNNVPLYQRLVLDQGYWPDGLLTAPSDEALKRDIELTLQLGYNGARKHQKFEDPRYLYWADKLGLLVWGELPSAYQLGWNEKNNMMRDLAEAVQRDYNHPSLITWVPLNESWGVHSIFSDVEAQRLANALYHLLKSLDGTRPVSGNDGWEHAATDIIAIHDYTAWADGLRADYKDASTLRLGVAGANKFIQAHNCDSEGKPMLVSEYGGIALQKDAKNNAWGYNGAEKNAADFLRRFENITKAFKTMDYISGYCYTQLTDVFQEVNGLLDMHRNPKINMDDIKRINLS